MARPPRRQRRLRGTGSVFARPDGRWEGRWQAPHDGSGERAWVRVYGRSESEADIALAEAIRNHKRGAAIADTRTTVDEYLTGWLERVVPTLKPGTRRLYDTACRVWIVPRIGAIAIGALTGLQVQRMIGGVETDHGVRSAGIAHAVLRKALADAKRLDRIIPDNVAQDARSPKYRRAIPAPWTLEQTTAFLEAIKGSRDEALYLLAAMVGPRPSEALGLTWSRVDLGRARATIDSAIQWPIGEKPYLDAPKSEAGTRTISLPPRVVAALQRHRADQDKAKKILDDRWLNDDLVFTERNGRPIRIDTLSHRFAKLTARHGFPHIRLYDLRHVAATLIIAAGGLEDARRTLGHSSIRLVAETYGFELEGHSRDVAAGVDSLLGGSLRTDTPSDTSSKLP